MVVVAVAVMLVDVVLVQGVPRDCVVGGDSNADGGVAIGAYCDSMLDGDAVVWFSVVADTPISSAALFHSARHPPGKYTGCDSARAGVEESSVFGIGGTGDWGTRSTLGRMGGIFSLGGLVMRSILSPIPRFFSSYSGIPERNMSSVDSDSTGPSWLCFRLSELRRDTLKSVARSSSNSLTRHVRSEVLDIAAVANGVGFLSMVTDMMRNGGLTHM